MRKTKNRGAKTSRERRPRGRGGCYRCLVVCTAAAVLEPFAFFEDNERHDLRSRHSRSAARQVTLSLSADDASHWDDEDESHALYNPPSHTRTWNQQEEVDVKSDEANTHSSGPPSVQRRLRERDERGEHAMTSAPRKEKDHHHQTPLHDASPEAEAASTVQQQERKTQCYPQPFLCAEVSVATCGGGQVHNPDQVCEIRFSQGTVCGGTCYDPAICCTARKCSDAVTSDDHCSGNPYFKNDDNHNAPCGTAADCKAGSICCIKGCTAADDPSDAYIGEDTDALLALPVNHPVHQSYYWNDPSNWHHDIRYLYCNHDNGFGGLPEFKCHDSNQRLEVRHCRRATCAEQYDAPKATNATAYACGSEYKRKTNYASIECDKGTCTRAECCALRKCKHVADVVSAAGNAEADPDFCDDAASKYDAAKANDNCGTQEACRQNCCIKRKCSDVVASHSNCTSSALGSPYFKHEAKNNNACGTANNCKAGAACCIKGCIAADDSDNAYIGEDTDALLALPSSHPVHNNANNFHVSDTLLYCNHDNGFGGQPQFKCQGSNQKLQVRHCERAKCNAQYDEAKASASAYVCDPNYKQKSGYASIECDKGTCTRAECCELRKCKHVADVVSAENAEADSDFCDDAASKYDAAKANDNCGTQEACRQNCCIKRKCSDVVASHSNCTSSALGSPYFKHEAKNNNACGTANNCKAGAACCIKGCIAADDSDNAYIGEDTDALLALPSNHPAHNNANNFHVSDTLLYCNHDNGFGGQPQFKCQGSNQKLQVRHCERAKCNAQYDEAKASASAYVCDPNYKQKSGYASIECDKGTCTRAECCELRRCKHVADVVSAGNAEADPDFCDDAASKYDAAKANDNCGTQEACRQNCCIKRKCSDVVASHSNCTSSALGSPYFKHEAKNNNACGTANNCKAGAACCIKGCIAADDSDNAYIGEDTDALLALPSSHPVHNNANNFHVSDTLLYCNHDNGFGGQPQFKCQGSNQKLQVRHCERAKCNAQYDEAKASASAYVCDPNYKQKSGYASIECDKGTCTRAECCELRKCKHVADVVSAGNAEADPDFCDDAASKYDAAKANDNCGTQEACRQNCCIKRKCSDVVASHSNCTSSALGSPYFKHEAKNNNACGTANNCKAGAACCIKGCIAADDSDNAYIGEDTDALLALPSNHPVHNNANNFHVSDTLLYCNHDNGFGGQPQFKCQGSNQKLQVRHCERAKCNAQYDEAKASASAYVCDPNYKQKSGYASIECDKGTCTRAECCELRKCKHVADVVSAGNAEADPDFCDDAASKYDAAKANDNCGTQEACRQNCCIKRKCSDVVASHSNCTSSALGSPYFKHEAKNNNACGTANNCKAGAACCIKGCIAADDSDSAYIGEDTDALLALPSSHPVHNNANNFHVSDTLLYCNHTNGFGGHPQFKCQGSNQKLQVRHCERAKCNAQYDEAKASASAYVCDPKYKQKSGYASIECDKGTCTRAECCEKRKCKHMFSVGNDWCDGTSGGPGTWFLDDLRPEFECGTVADCSFDACCLKKCRAPASSDAYRFNSTGVAAMRTDEQSYPGSAAWAPASSILACEGDNGYVGISPTVECKGEDAVLELAGCYRRLCGTNAHGKTPFTCTSPGYRKKSNYDAIECATADCSRDECCIENCVLPAETAKAPLEWYPNYSDNNQSHDPSAIVPREPRRMVDAVWHFGLRYDDALFWRSHGLWHGRGTVHLRRRPSGASRMHARVLL